jgi:hypothetical protein
MSSPARPTLHDRPGGVGKPDPSGTGLRDWPPGLVAAVLATPMSTSALRAPVLVVRPQPAPPRVGGGPPRGGGARRRCARHEVAGRRRGGQLLISSQRISLARCKLSTWLWKAVPVRCADDAGECSARRHRFGTKSSVADAVLLSPGHNDALDFPDRSTAPCLVPAHGHMPTDRGRRCRHAGGGQVVSQFGWPAGLRGVRCPSLGCGWLLSR